MEDHDLPIQNRGTYAAPVIKPINPRHKQPLTQILLSAGLFISQLGAGLCAAPVRWLAADRSR